VEPPTPTAIFECLTCGMIFDATLKRLGCPRCKAVESTYPELYTWIRDVLRVAVMDHLHGAPHGRGLKGET
jgi:phage FluMu protein Com